MLIANKYNFPDKCPETCPNKDLPLDQSSLCTHCPVFGCRVGPLGSYLIHPDLYREDWAAEFHKYITNPTSENYPKLSTMNKDTR